MPDEEIEQPSKFDLWVERRLGSEKAEKVLLSTAVGLGIVLSIALFIFLPDDFSWFFLDSLVTTAVTRNLTEGAIRILIFLAYMYFATKVKDIKRIWQYHGAEHKTIHCYEKGLDLTVENIRGQSRFHPPVRNQLFADYHDCQHFGLLFLSAGPTRLSAWRCAFCFCLSSSA